jgi:hypothetical protein
MNKALIHQLLASLEYGKSDLTFIGIMDVVNYREQVVKKYIDHPKMNLDEQVLRIITDHKENLIPLAELILELKGWLITHTDKTQMRLMIEKRVYDLSIFMLQLMFNVRVIAKMITLEEVLSQETLKTNAAKRIANEILNNVEEVTAFATQNHK